MKNNIARIFLFNSVLGGVLLMAQGAMAQTHLVIGSIQNSDLSATPSGDITWTASITIPDRTGEVITETSPGSNTGEGDFQMDVNDFTTAWAPGETLTVNFLNPTTGEVATKTLVLNTDPSQVLDVVLAPPTCPISLTPSVFSASHLGEPSLISIVNALAGCIWETPAPTNDDDWLRSTFFITTIGGGPGSIQFEVDPNPFAAPRVGTITLASGLTITVNQSGNPDCVQNPSNSVLIPVGTVPDLTWCPDPNAVQYQVWLARKVLGIYIPFHIEWVDAPASSWTPDIDLLCGEYEWWVRTSYANRIFGTWVGPARFEIDCCYPAQPQLTAPAGCLDASAGGGTLTYEWENQVCASWYLLWVNQGFLPWHVKWIKVDPNAGPYTYELPGHTPGLYQWWVRPYAPPGLLGPWSEGTSFGVGLVEPQSLTTNTVCWETDCLGSATWIQVWIKQDDVTIVKQWVWFALLPSNCWELPLNLPAGDYQVYLRSWSLFQGYGPWSPGTDYTL